MATIRKEIAIDKPAGEVWDAIRDAGAVHTRLAKGFTVDTRLEEGCRYVTFINGAVVRENIVAIDDEQQRFVYSVVEWRASHHNASFQVFAEGEDRCRIVWVADFLPDSINGLMDGLMEQGSSAIRGTLG